MLAAVLIYAALLIYGSLYPFRHWHAPALPAMQFLFAWPAHLDKADLLREMNARQAAGQPLVIGALGDGVVPVTLVHRTRAVSFGAALAGGYDVTGDGIPDLVVGAPGASDASDGGGAVFLYAGGRGQEGALSPFLMVVGDVSERGALGQDVALLPGATGGVAPQLMMGAPRSFRTGTQNGTAFALPLVF